MRSTSSLPAVLWLHGLGDSGSGWKGAFGPLTKQATFHHPTAPEQPVTSPVHQGEVMTSWFDIKLWPLGLSEPQDGTVATQMDETVANIHKKLEEALGDAEQEKAAIPFVMASSQAVLAHFIDDHPILYRDMLRAGVQFTNICTVVFQGMKGMAAIERGVTNSNKARFYSALRLYDDDDLIQIALTGKAPY